MSRHVFDHDADRLKPLSIHRLAVLGVALIAVAASVWAVFGSGVHAQATRPVLTEAQGLTEELAGPRRVNMTLIEAVQARDQELVAVMLGRGADLNECDVSNRSALSWAIENDDTSMVRRLLAAGARLGSPGRACGSDLHLAALHDDPLLLSLILGAQSSVDSRAEALDDASALHLASEAGHMNSVGALLDAGADIDARDARGFTPLARAALLSRGEVLELLLRRGANLRARDEQGRSALQLATAVGDRVCVRILLDAGAAPGQCDERGWNALHYAAAHGRADLIPLLVHAQDHATLHARTARNATALHLAARHGEANALQCWLDLGLDPNARDADGRNARDMTSSEQDGKPWTSLGPPTQQPQGQRMQPALQDYKTRRPVVCVCTHPARTLRGPLELLDIAIWEDGAMVFSPWAADGSRRYEAAVMPASSVTSLLRDLEESGWIGIEAPPIDTANQDCIELTLLLDGELSRSTWDEAEDGELVSGLKNRAARADSALAWARVRDVLRTTRQGPSMELAHVLVRGSFRGLSFAAGAQADWLR